MSGHEGSRRGRGLTDVDEPIRGWVFEVCRELRNDLGPNHVGTYLHGSLAAGSFHPPKSDVDVLFVVERPLDTAVRRRFSMTAVRATRDRPIVGGLECSVILRGAAANPVHPIPYEVHFSEDWVDDLGEDRIAFDENRTDRDLAAHVQATCEFGIPLAGPPVSSVFTPPRKEDFLDSVLYDFDWIVEGEHILESPFYGVLNVARVIWALENVSGRLVPSKDEAGEWLLESAPAERRPVVRLALEAYRDPSPISPEARPRGGRAWPRQSLLAFRDWARRYVKNHLDEGEPPRPC